MTMDDPYTSSFYDADHNLLPEPKYTLTELETMLADAKAKLRLLSQAEIDTNNSYNNDLQLSLARFNLCSYIENLEWKIDLKNFYAKNCFSD